MPWVSSQQKKEILKILQVQVTPAIYPRFIEFPHFCRICRGFSLPIVSGIKASSCAVIAVNDR